MNEWIFGMVAGFVKGLIKNPVKKRKMRNVALEIFRAIKTAYADDEGFQ